MSLVSAHAISARRFAPRTLLQTLKTSLYLACARPVK